MENGKLHVYNSRNYVSQSECKITDTTNSLGIPKLATLFLMLIFGYVLSFLILLREHFFGPKIKESTYFEMQEKKELKIRIEEVKKLLPQIKNESLKKKTENIILQINALKNEYLKKKSENLIFQINALQNKQA